jgi:hypothetical protein
MTTDEMDVRTDLYTKSDSSAFPATEKLAYYVEADGILNSLIIRNQEDRAEEEWTKATVADQDAYKEKARIHNVKWLKVNYGDGFVPARYMSEGDQKARYGSALAETLDSWDKATPIYWWKGSHLFIAPAPDADQAGADRLWASIELLPTDLDRSDNNTPTLVPVNFHHLHPAYAAMSWLDEDDPLWAKAKRKWDEGVAFMLETMYPRAREAEETAGYPAEEGWDL